LRTYLVVDDNFPFAENLAEILRDGGARVQIAEDGAGAMRLVQQERFDAVVTDMRMPAMSGATLVHEIRRVDPGLPAIIVSAYTGESDLLAAREQGLLAVLPKPAPLGRLTQLLGSARRDGVVALVEDDAALADNLAEALRDRGFTTVMAQSLTETERLGGFRPFAALVDLRMPGGPDGAALARLEQKFPFLPVLVMSAHPDALAQVPPASAFAKPFDTGELLDAVETLWR
jgi:DNA-binding NtrC family response regulator